MDVLVVGMGSVERQPGGLNRYVADLCRTLGVRPLVVDARTPLPLRLLQVFARTPRAGVIDAHFAPYALATIARRPRTPLVVHFHGPWADESVAAGEGGARVAAKRAIERFVYRRARVVVTLTEAFATLAHERYGVPRERIVVMPPGVDLERFAPGERRANERRTILAVRRLVPRMGIDVLLRAVVPDDELVIVGDGPERARLEAQAGANVRFAGRVPEEELADRYRDADVSVVPSVAYEGFGLVVLESLACGTPVVATDVGGLPEALAPLDPSLIVPAGDAAALRARLALPLPDAATCRAYAERFSWNAVAASHRALYAAAAKPRVVFVDHTAKLSGGELALLRLVPHLDVDATVVLGEDGPLAERLRDAGVRVEVLPFGARDVPRGEVGAGLPALASLLYAFRLARLLRRLRPDLVHTNSLKAALVGGLAGRLARVPVVWHLRDRLADDYLPPRALQVARAAARILPSATLANSRATAETVPFARRLRVVASPVEAVAPVERNGHVRRVAIVGRIAPWKGQDVFVRAFARAFPEPGVEGAVIGAPLFGADEERYADDVRALAAELGIADRVSFTGFTDDVAAELARTDVLVHASVVPEPFGQVVVEGMASGAAVVAAAAGGPAEVIDDGVDGLLYPPGDVDALAEALRRVADDHALRERLAEAGRAKAARYAPQRIAAEVMDVYREVLGR